MAETRGAAIMEAVETILADPDRLPFDPPDLITACRGDGCPFDQKPTRRQQSRCSMCDRIVVGETLARA